MSTVGQAERVTQNRVIALFRDKLGYRNLGESTDREIMSLRDADLTAPALCPAGHVTGRSLP